MSASVKEFKDYEGQLGLLLDRGMIIGDHDNALSQLRRVNYYRLSGYWYPFREKVGKERGDNFYQDTSFEDVIRLYEFDARLRTVTFDALAPVELTLRALLGHELGQIDECAHLKPHLLSALAKDDKGVRDAYLTWLKKYNEALRSSKEDFVKHHQDNYGGLLPVWAAVEILDLGSLRYLYGFSPRSAQNNVADHFGLRAPQLGSWMRSLEIIRNACAHHGRLYNRVYTKAPRLPDVGLFPALDSAGPHMTRTFGQLTLIQHMRQMAGLGPSRALVAVLKGYPKVDLVPAGHLGLPPDWNTSELWPQL